MNTTADGPVPSTVAQQVEAGLAALDVGEFDQAITLFKAAQHQSPQSMTIQQYLGEAQAAAGDLVGAQATLAAIPAAQIADPAVLVDLAYLYQMTGDNDRAAATIAQAVALQPDNLTVQLAQARLYESQDNDEQAVPIYAALVEATQLPIMATQLARLNLRLGKYREADRAFQQLATLDPDADLVARHGRIWAQIKRGDWRSALQQALGAAKADRFDLTTALLAYARDRLFTRVADAEIATREADLELRFQAELRDQIELQEADLLALLADDEGGETVG